MRNISSRFVGIADKSFILVSVSFKIFKIFINTISDFVEVITTVGSGSSLIWHSGIPDNFDFSSSETVEI